MEAIKGIGKDAEIVVNENGGKQSKCRFRNTGGNPLHFNGEMKAGFLQETIPHVIY